MKLLSLLFFTFTVSSVMADGNHVANNMELSAYEQLNFMSDNKCKIKDQSGTIDVFCKGGSIRCYADVEFENGIEMTIKGGCFSSYADCWSSGPGAVNPCD